MVGRPFLFPFQTRPTELMEERWIGSRWDRSPMVNPGKSGHSLVSRPDRIQMGSDAAQHPPSSPAEKIRKAFSESFPDKYPDFFYDFPTENPIGFFFIFPVGFFRGFRRGLQRLASPPSLSIKSPWDEIREGRRGIPMGSIQDRSSFPVPFFRMTLVTLCFRHDTEGDRNP